RERVRLEAERAHAEQQRADAEREEQTRRAQSEAKDQFLAILSHELRTPLTPVMTAAHQLSTMPLGDEVSHLVDVIRRNVELETRLIADLLDATRIDRGRLDLAREDM